MPTNRSKCRPSPGFGLGLRTTHYHDFLEQAQPVQWLEVISDNYLVPGGKPIQILNKIRESYPVAMHGVAMSIGSSKGLDDAYLRRLKSLADQIEPLWVSDHLCWSSVHGRSLHDLLPLPYDEGTLKVVVNNIERAQDILQRRLVVENVSTYLEFVQSDRSEWQFLSEVCEAADCLLLLDVNNVYVSSVNHGFDPHDYLNSLPSDRIQQIHLAGHTNYGTHIIDTHDHPVCESVWELYRYACQRFGPIAAMIERDDDIPPLQVLIEELNHARQICSETLSVEALQ